VGEEREDDREGGSDDDGSQSEGDAYATVADKQRADVGEQGSSDGSDSSCEAAGSTSGQQIARRKQGSVAEI
jgi:hypothetical protein